MTSTLASTRAPYLARPEDQEILHFLEPQRLLVGGEHTNYEFALLEGGGRRGFGPPRHLHRHAEETFIVLSGELLIDVDGDQHTAGAGHVAVLRKNVPHTFIVLSEHARFLTLHTPAGFDEFVRHVSDLSAGGKDVDRATFAAVAAEHGIDILGPGLTLDDAVQRRPR